MESSKDSPMVTSATDGSSSEIDVNTNCGASGDIELGVITGQEYETQLFGFTPKSFSDGCKHYYNLVVLTFNRDSKIINLFSWFLCSMVH